MFTYKSYEFQEPLDLAALLAEKGSKTITKSHIIWLLHFHANLLGLSKPALAIDKVTEIVHQHMSVDWTLEKSSVKR
jgi:hypothetical protein